MATTSTLPENNLREGARSSTPDLLVTLSALAPGALDQVLANLSVAFPVKAIEVATPDPAPTTLPAPNLSVVNYAPAALAPGIWVLTAADFLNTYKLLKERSAPCCLMLGPDAQSLAPEALRALADAVTQNYADLVMPHYSLGPRDGLVNSAILYPVTRALFGARPRYPLAIDLGCSSRMAERLAVVSQKLTTANQNAALVWPVAEAASAGMSVAEVEVGSRSIPAPDAVDLNSLLAQVAGSFFAEIDAKASHWQRARLAPEQRTNPAPIAPISHTEDSAEAPDINPMLDSFRLAYTNLHDIWSLVLPPNSLLGLKKLSLLSASIFRMPDALWVRIVYDFILAYRLRTINRGHLLGAFTPLYLAWVASHLLLTSGAAAETIAPEKHIELLAAAFEIDKPYLVARWRWPDRFNP